MRYLLNHTEMQSCDTSTIRQYGIPSEVLMERAALAVRDTALDRFHPQSVLVLCGSGNNGGDGFACARLLLIAGVKTDVLFLGNHAHMTDSCRLQEKIFLNYGGQILPDDTPLHGYDLIIDALFGIGLKRDVIGRYADVIRAVNRTDTPVLSIDIPSGISADDGQIRGDAVRADVTVTFQYEKLGQKLFPGASFCGDLVLRDVGINPYMSGSPVFTLDESDLPSLLPEKHADDNKGSCGKLLLIAGDLGMAGAAILAAKAAFRSGVGMVCVLTHPENRIPLQTAVPEAIFAPWPEKAGCTGPDSGSFRAENAVSRSSSEQGEEDSLPVMNRWLCWCDAIAVGPGLGTGSRSLVLLSYFLQKTDKPMVIDADALNLLSANPSLWPMISGRTVLTPHPGEMKRLIEGRKTVPDSMKVPHNIPEETPGSRQAHTTECDVIPEDIRPLSSDIRDIVSHPIDTVLGFSRESGSVVVLKGARTAVTDGKEVMLNTCGNEGMATAGSGDTLTGIIGSLLAQGLEPFSAAQAGVLLHALAGDRAVGSLGKRSLAAGDLSDYLPEVLRNR